MELRLIGWPRHPFFTKRRKFCRPSPLPIDTRTTAVSSPRNYPMRARDRRCSAWMAEHPDRSDWKSWWASITGRLMERAWRHRRRVIHCARCCLRSRLSSRYRRSRWRLFSSTATLWLSASKCSWSKTSAASQTSSTASLQPPRRSSRSLLHHPLLLPTILLPTRRCCDALLKQLGTLWCFSDPTAKKLSIRPPSRERRCRTTTSEAGSRPSQSSVPTLPMSLRKG